MFDLSARLLDCPSGGMSGILCILLDAAIVLLPHRCPQGKQKREHQDP